METWEQNEKIDFYHPIPKENPDQLIKLIGDMLRAIAIFLKVSGLQGQ